MPAKTPKKFTAWKNRILARFPWFQLWLIRRSDVRQLRRLEKKFGPITQDNYGDYSLERDLILHPTYGLIAETLEAKARKLGIRVPDKPTPTQEEDDENWEWSNYYGNWMLTSEGERRLRNEIREEQRPRADEWRKWGTLFFVLVGTIFAFLSYRTRQKQPDPCSVNYYRN